MFGNNPLLLVKKLKFYIKTKYVYTHGQLFHTPFSLPSSQPLLGWIRRIPIAHATFHLVDVFLRSLDVFVNLGANAFRIVISPLPRALRAENSAIRRREILLRIA